MYFRSHFNCWDNTFSSPPASESLRAMGALRWSYFAKQKRPCALQKAAVSAQSIASVNASRPPPIPRLSSIPTTNLTRGDRSLCAAIVVSLTRRTLRSNAIFVEHCCQKALKYIVRQEPPLRCQPQCLTVRREQSSIDNLCTRICRCRYSLSPKLTTQFRKVYSLIQPKPEKPRFLVLPIWRKPTRLRRFRSSQESL